MEDREDYLGDLLPTECLTVKARLDELAKQEYRREHHIILVEMSHYSEKDGFREITFPTGEDPESGEDSQLGNIVRFYADGVEYLAHDHEYRDNSHFSFKEGHHYRVIDLERRSELWFYCPLSQTSENEETEEGKEEREEDNGPFAQERR